ncbi:MAG: polyketide synthase dehydratase domain-containing protein [Deltaproteobacteria bacterium]|nr:polyketide synthase dehydratase domain-containing protein [Deltaproteobacteria bacterium]
MLPAAAQLEMMLAAAATQGAATVREVRLSRALVIDHDGINTLTLDLGEGGELVLTGVTDDEAPVELTRAILGGAAGTAPRQDLPSLTAQMPLSAPTGLYERLTTMGLSTARPSRPCAASAARAAGCSSSWSPRLSWAASSCTRRSSTVPSTPCSRSCPMR